MTDGPAKRGEARLIIVTVVAVLAFGGLVMGAIYGLLQLGDPGKAAQCHGWEQVGEVGSVRDASKDSPTQYNLGNGCEASVIVHDGSLRAIKPRLTTCTEALTWIKKDKAFTCRGTAVPWETLSYWPTRIVTHDELHDLEIDFGKR